MQALEAMEHWDAMDHTCQNASCMAGKKWLTEDGPRPAAVPRLTLLGTLHSSSEQRNEQAERLEVRSAIYMPALLRALPYFWALLEKLLIQLTSCSEVYLNPLMQPSVLLNTTKAKLVLPVYWHTEGCQLTGKPKAAREG